MKNLQSFRRLAVLSVAAVCGVVAMAQTPSREADPAVGLLFTETNAVAGNAVDVYARSVRGNLRFLASVPTNGTGTGSGLGSQGAVTLSENKQWLFVVNAGSNTVSTFRVQPNGLTLTDVTPSGGVMPISVAENNGTVYVLNGGGTNNISGFRLDQDGQLNELPGSTRMLSGASVGPAQVGFSPSGDILVVSEKATNMLTSYALDFNAVPSSQQSFAASGVTPFGFAWDKRNRLYVSEAFVGGTNQSALSSYITSVDGGLSVITGSAPTHQTAACWTVVTNNGRYAYTTNAGSRSVTGFAIARDGSLSLLDPTGLSGQTAPNTAPIDAAVSPNDNALFVLTGRTPTIASFGIGNDGNLTPVSTVSLSSAHAGLAVR